LPACGATGCLWDRPRRSGRLADVEEIWIDFHDDAGLRHDSEGFNKVENHARFEAIAHELIDKCAAGGSPNMIGLTGERKGQDPKKGLDNCVTFMNKIKSHLEDKNITISVEYLNSKVNHKDYDFDHMAYGVELCKRVNSPRVKILYDMYHVQIMEGDIIRMMRDNIQYIGHFHTAGNPAVMKWTIRRK
jgi:hydroxypyruvate isomerase